MLPSLEASFGTAHSSGRERKLAWIVLGLLILRAVFSAIGPFAGKWPFFAYDMYSSRAAAGVGMGIPLLAVETGTGLTCRIPVRGFGARPRLDVTGLFRAGAPSPLLLELRRLCFAGLGGGDTCRSDRFRIFWLKVGRTSGSDTTITEYGVTTNGISLAQESRPLVDLGALFPGDGCGNRK